jgi:hypothetical protein
VPEINSRSCSVTYVLAPLLLDAHDFFEGPIVLNTEFTFWDKGNLVYIGRERFQSARNTASAGGQPAFHHLSLSPRCDYSPRYTHEGLSQCTHGMHTPMSPGTMDTALLPLASGGTQHRGGLTACGLSDHALRQAPTVLAVLQPD